MKNKIVLHQLVLFIVLVLLSILGWTGQPDFVNLDLLWWWLGGVLGFVFVFSDRFIYSLVTRPDESLGLRLHDLFGQRKFVEGLKMLISERHEQRELAMRSFLFVICWVILAFWTMVAAINPFAKGLLIGIGTHLIFDLIYDFMWDKERFDLWFWQIKRPIEEGEKKWFVVIVSLIYVLIIVRL